MVTPEDLRRVPLFADIEEAGLQWLCENGHEVWVEAGEVHRSEGDSADYVFILLEGRIRITQRVDDQERILITYDRPTLYGEIPMLTGSPTYWAQGRALVRTHLLQLTNDQFWKMLTHCPKVTKQIFRTMAERIQSIQAVAQQRERLAALGTLAAGLAHEINNPAAAARQATQQLGEILKQSRARACRLSATAWNLEQREYLKAVQEEISAYCRQANALDPIVQSDCEEVVSNWLDSHAVANSWELAPVLVSAGFDLARLDDLAAHVPAEGLEDVLHWIGSGATADGLVIEVQTCTERIIQLVEEVKSYTYLNRGDQQEVDIREGLESTLAILAPRLKAVAILRDYAPDLPRICAYGSELNQVWTNLLENAVDAVNEDGRIWIKTRCEGDGVLVEVANDGPVIPPEVMEHIFEPFFTTKDVGAGTGLGLVIARRIVVERHGGDIKVHSEPDSTCFEVRLPVQQGVRL